MVFILCVVFEVIIIIVNIDIGYFIGIYVNSFKLEDKEINEIFLCY